MSCTRRNNPLVIIGLSKNKEKPPNGMRFSTKCDYDDIKNRPLRLLNKSVKNGH